jgi:hypothetical protein
LTKQSPIPLYILSLLSCFCSFTFTLSAGRDITAVKTDAERATTLLCCYLRLYGSKAYDI